MNSIKKNLRRKETGAILSNFFGHFLHFVLDSSVLFLGTQILRMILDFFFDGFDFVRLIQEMTKSGIAVSHFTLSITVKTLGIGST